MSRQTKVIIQIYRLSSRLCVSTHSFVGRQGILPIIEKFEPTHSPNPTTKRARGIFNKPPSVPNLPYVTLSAILYMLNAIHPQYQWKQDIKDLEHV